MIKPIFYSVKFHISGDNRFSLSKGYRFQHDDLVFDSYKQIWNVNRHGHWYRDNTHEPEYFDSLKQFFNTSEIKNWLNEICYQETMEISGTNNVLSLIKERVNVNA